jgi:hypothetical protein
MKTYLKKLLVGAAFYVVVGPLILILMAVPFAGMMSIAWFLSRFY